MLCIGTSLVSHTEGGTVLRLRVFENRVVGKTTVPKRKNLRKNWKKLHNE
jgi:hypothetical protein